jgi:hypothetical protein
MCDANAAQVPPRSEQLIAVVLFEHVSHPAGRSAQCEQGRRGPVGHFTDAGQASQCEGGIRRADIEGFGRICQLLGRREEWMFADRLPKWFDVVFR